MPKPPAIRLTTTAFVAIFLALIVALFMQSYLRLELQRRGFDVAYAKDLSYLVVPPLLFLMLFQVLGQQKDFLIGLFRWRHLSLRVVTSAIALGLLLRVAWWSQLIARTSFGWARSKDPDGVVGPVFAFNCPPPHIIGLGFFVAAFLIPVVEEVVHRGLIQSAFVHRGRTATILLSALVFALFHTPSSYIFVFAMGVVFGAQFWNSQTLLPTMITHATFNGLIQIDWRCLHGTWNPTSDQLPLVTLGSVALVTLILAMVSVVRLLIKQDAGVPDTPRP